jgi:FixJ family two-component response regulator
VCLGKAAALKRSRIIAIVDDDPGMLGSLGDLLAAYGFEPKVFSSAQSWLDESATGPYDCLVLDIQLPGMSGLELHRRLKASGSTVPVVFMTAFEDEAVRAQMSGCIACLRKPFSPRQLIEAIESVWT